jgi:3-oxoacyl-[acyl-carrier protein] reductase
MNSTSINFSEFKNKKILITGGSTGIGAALAKAFAKQGAIVGLHYLSSVDAANQVASEIRSEGGSVELIKADASDSQALVVAVKEAAERLGGLNGLINNAGWHGAPSTIRRSY